MRALPENACHAQRDRSFAPVAPGRLGLDLGDQLGDATANLAGWKVAPAGERLEVEAVVGSEVGVRDVFTAVPGAVLLGAVVPDALGSLAGNQGGGAVSAGPMGDLGNEGLLDAVGEQVAQAADLRKIFFRHEDGLVAPLQERTAPAVETTRFFGDVGGDIPHEGGELLGIGWAAEQVEMIGEHHEGVELDVVALSGAGEDADEDLAKAGGGLEQEPPLKTPGGDLDERPVGKVADSARHASKNGIGRSTLALSARAQLEPIAGRTGKSTTGKTNREND